MSPSDSFAISLFLPKKNTFPKFFATLNSFVCFYFLFHPRNSYCSYQFYRYSHFPLISVFTLGFVCYILQCKTCEIKLYFPEMLLQVLSTMAQRCHISCSNHFWFSRKSLFLVSA